jgi:hypothetical protein
VDVKITGIDGALKMHMPTCGMLSSVVNEQQHENQCEETNSKA